MKVTEIFIEWLKYNHYFDEFETLIMKEWGIMVPDYLERTNLTHKFPSLFVLEAFVDTIVPDKDKKNPYEKWRKVHEEWFEYVKENNLQDYTEWHETFK